MAAQSGAAGAQKDERLASLRKEMEAAGVVAVVVPSEDPHQSEYAAACFERRQYISRFTGSAGTAVVTLQEALLWTDGRYFLQAENELGPEWRLMRAGLPTTPDVPAYLKDSLPAESHVGIDAQVHSAASARALRTALADGGHKLVPLATNLVDKVWEKEARPAAPSASMRVHELRWAGDTVQSKLDRVRVEMAKVDAQVLVVAMLDEVCWLLNVRGADVDFNPVTVSYVLVHTDGATLYVDAAKVSEPVAAHLATAGVTVKPYNAVWADLTAAAKAGKRVWADPNKVSLAIFETVEEAGGEAAVAARAKARRRGGAAPSGSGKKGGSSDASAPAAAAAAAKAPILESASPLAMAKAIKNTAELDGMREAHLRDAAALAEFFQWLEETVASGKAVTEAAAADHLRDLRAKQEGFIEPSFPTIAGEGPNGAVIHYRPVEGTARAIGKASMLLLDSGGQFDCGTTDVTRTIHFGQPSAWQRECFTRVLQGHIALDRVVFPEATPGFVLDAFARRGLWEAGLDYRHGTGHGVGAALNVHEGPQGISPRFGNMTGLQAGMVVSNEPGYYEDGAFGIRIENLEIIRDAQTAHRFGGTSFLSFERLTMVPLQAKMIELSMLSAADIEWVDTYHKQVLDLVAPRVSGKALEWLQTNCRPLQGGAGAAAGKNGAGGAKQKVAA